MTTAYRCRQLASMVRHGEVVRVAEVAELLEELAKIHELNPPPNLEEIGHRVEERARAEAEYKRTFGHSPLADDCQNDRRDLFDFVAALAGFRKSKP